jgi:hypothetical protein
MVAAAADMAVRLALRRRIPLRRISLAFGAVVIALTVFAPCAPVVVRLAALTGFALG